ncbi:MAG TPA: hypothetical protein VH208_01295 [Myxococcaceae bacterium]|nr:hypothetical protein [Myxococcaceae bacterium]
MAEARVDKSWQSKGLAGYPLDAILGTLRHYGADTSQADFEKLAIEKFPLAIAAHWRGQWRGTGQFVAFPDAAAEELWRRFAGTRLSPALYAEALLSLMDALSRMVEGAPDAPVGAAFSRVDQLKAQLPLEGAGVREDFAVEVASHLGQQYETFNHVAEALAKEGHVEDAESFAAVEELLFRERAGVARATVQAAKGERAPALEALLRLAADAARGGGGRLTAIDALLSLEALAEGETAATALLDELERAADYHMAFNVMQRLAYALEKQDKQVERQSLQERAAKLAQAHQAAHPDH